MVIEKAFPNIKDDDQVSTLLEGHVSVFSSMIEHQKKFWQTLINL